MRQFFDDWGVDLNDQTFACAVGGRLVELGHTPAGWQWTADWKAIRQTWDIAPRGPAALAASWAVFTSANPAPRVIVPDVEALRGPDAGFAFAVLDWLGRATPAVRCVVADTTGADPARI